MGPIKLILTDKRVGDERGPLGLLLYITILIMFRGENLVPVFGY
jgi:hypothetical protein